MEKDVLRGKLVRNDKLIVKKYKLFFISMIVGLSIILCSIIIGIAMNLNRFDSSVQHHQRLAVIVSGVHEQDDTIKFGSGDVTSHMFHLTGSYIQDGSSTDVVLNEAYPDLDMALNHMEEVRTVYVDTDRGIEVIPKSVNYVFIVPAFLGLVITIVSFLGVYRYSTEYELLRTTKKKRRRD